MSRLDAWKSSHWNKGNRVVLVNVVGPLCLSRSLFLGVQSNTRCAKFAKFSQRAVPRPPRWLMGHVFFFPGRHWKQCSMESPEPHIFQKSELSLLLCRRQNFPHINRENEFVLAPKKTNPVQGLISYKFIPCLFPRVQSYLHKHTQILYKTRESRENAVWCSDTHLWQSRGHMGSRCRFVFVINCFVSL
jgi:hypothetical protein